MPGEEFSRRRPARMQRVWRGRKSQDRRTRVLGGSARVRRSGRDLSTGRQKLSLADRAQLGRDGLGDGVKLNQLVVGTWGAEKEGAMREGRRL